MNNTGYPSIDNRHNDGKSFFQKHQVVPNMSIYNMLGMISSFYRDAIAVDCLDLRVTYQELLDNADILAKSFKELGIKKGEVIVASMPNFFQAIAVYLAANKIGAITSFLNPGCTKDEIKYYLNEFESPLYVDYDKDEFNAEVERIKSVNQPFRDIVKNIFFAKTGFKYPAYITIWDGNGTYEYALVDEENTTIAYVLNQLFDWKDTDIAEEYLPKDYSVPSTSKDTGKDGYSMYYVYDEFGTGYRFDELH